MRQAHYFLKIQKYVSADESSVNARLLEQAGYIQKVMAGVYIFLPLGMRVLAKIENIIRQEMDAIGANEVLMPAMHPKENWIKTKRWDNVDVLFKVKSQHGYEAALGPTHEEIVTPMAVPVISSYKDLPLAVYQIQTKFRDEPRAKSGLLRGREFRMKDLYSFHATQADLERYYKIVASAYIKIFKRFSLDALYTEASGGMFTKYSHEFQVEIENGEDVIYVCTGCALAKNKEIFKEGVSCTNCGKNEFRETKASEVGNIFELSTRFSESFDLRYTAQDGSRPFVHMGCYGMGPSRIMGVLVEKFHDQRGIIWPESVAPFSVNLVSLYGKNEKRVREASDRVYNDVQAEGIEVLYDDREGKTPGERFADSDLIGIPWRVVVSEKTLDQDSVELKPRSKSETTLVKLSDLAKSLKR